MDCCHHCADVAPPEPWYLRFATMIVCGRCGNKRCPHASDHRLPCSGSNEPGQPGSVY